MAYEREIEGACPPVDRASLGGLVRRAARQGMLAIEVGSWFGLSTSVIARIAREFNGVLYCVDHWQGSSAEANELARAGETDVFQGFKSNMVRLGLWKHIRPMMMPSMDAARIFRDETADLVFIDADHRYEAVLEDIRGWLPKVRSGGIICGHDYGGHPGVVRAVNEVFEGKANRAPSCVWWVEC